MKTEASNTPGARVDAGLTTRAGANEPAIAGADVRWRVSDYVALTKPRLNALVIATSGVGFYVASKGPLDLPLLLHTVMGSA